jgi:PST family polysaccharide transporter
MSKYFTKLKNIFNKAEYQRIGANVLSLMLLNGIYFLSPLILIPYLMKTIGSELYGVYIFSWTIVYYFIFIVNYGFDYSSTREIAINRYDKDKVSEIYSTTFYSRLLLLAVSIFILFLTIIFIDKINTNAQLILLGLGVIAGQAFFPTWLFQGMEEMKFITIINSIIRILPIILIFIFVKSGSDIDYIMGFQSVGYVVGGVFSHFFAIKHFELTLKRPNIQKIKNNLRSGWSLFLSTVGVSLYREANTVILGFITNNFVLVGYYALADKFIRIVQLIANSFSQALFPYFGHNLMENKKVAIRKFRKVGLYYAIFLLTASVALYFFIPWLIKIYLSNDYPEIVRDVRIMSPIILIGGLNYYLGVAGLVNLNHKNIFTTFVLITGFVNITLSIFLSKIYLDAGAAVSLTIAETVLFLMIISYLQLKEKIFNY